MKKENAVKLFEQKQIRTHWDANEEKWYFSIVDVVGVLTDSPNPRKYWSVLKTRLKKEGSELATNCSQLKMQSTDDKFYNTDVADTEQLFRLIQSVPSKKAEPFKLWLAKVGRERIDEIENSNMETQLSEMPNIGKILSERLVEVGIDSPEELKAAGSENAFVRLKTVDSGACLSMLCALEGAVQGIRWHNLDSSRKTELKEFLKILNKQR